MQTILIYILYQSEQLFPKVLIFFSSPSSVPLA